MKNTKETVTEEELVAEFDRKTQSQLKELCAYSDEEFLQGADDYEQSIDEWYGLRDEPDSTRKTA